MSKLVLTQPYGYAERVTEAQGTADASRPRAGAGAIQGAGPRIYVGGIPTAVSETMVKNYFSNWGKVCFGKLHCPLLA